MQEEVEELRERSLRTLEKRKSKERNERGCVWCPLIVPSPYLTEKQAEEKEMLSSLQLFCCCCKNQSFVLLFMWLIERG